MNLPSIANDSTTTCIIGLPKTSINGLGNVYPACAKSGDDGFVTEVAEKQVISEDATVGVYYWSKGSDYVKYAEDMIQKDIRVNNEFYVCPVFNQAIEDKKKIKVYDVEEMWGLGTPEDLDFYHNHFKN